MRSGATPHDARPSRHFVASCSANASGVEPARCASPSLIHGRKSVGRSSGNVSARLVRSPFGSMISAGTPDSSASSSSTTPRPVLPDPVMPTITPCVVKSLAASMSGFPSRECVAASICSPM